MSHSAETAQTLILIGLILQAITLFVLLGIGLFFLVVPFLGGLVLFLAFLDLVWLILVYAYSYARTRDGQYEEARTPTLVFGILSLLSGGVLSGILYLIGYLKLGDAADESFEERRAYEASEARRRLSAPSPPAPRPTYSLANPAPYVPASARPASPPLASAQPGSAPLASQANFCPNCGRPTVAPARFCRHCGLPLEP